MDLCNIVAYKGNLKCGSKAVQTSLIAYGNRQWKEHELIKSGGTLSAIKSLKTAWLENCLDETNIAVFLDTDSLGTNLEKYGPTKSGRKGGSANLSNPTEVDLIVDIVTGLRTACRFDLKDVGIITHYRFVITSCA